jgi:predicted GH43/DUF377 family glycosyl hydrolase
MRLARSTASLVTILLGALAGACGRYGDFTLPLPRSDGPQPPFAWQPSAGPVLGRGEPAQWDSVDVLNPSVVRFQGRYLNLYSGFDGRAWHTGAATSSDGVHWSKQGRILSPSGWEGAYIAANGSALVQDNEILYWYQAGDPPRIALARSPDGIAWSKEAGPVVSTGPRGSFDERGVADPYVIRAAGQYSLFYVGEDRARRQRLGIARSRDGVHWEKLRSSPLLELGSAGAFDENGLGEPAVWSSAGSYWMLYTGRDHEEHRRIGLAKSPDGVHWERESGFVPLVGSEPWDSSVLCDPTLEVMDHEVRVWFGGGDVPHPDENIHGQIGMGVLVSAK